MTKLTADVVENTLMKCLFEADEPIDDAVIVEGIINPYGFHPGRLEEHRQLINELLDELPKEFHLGSGGGWTFLNACMDRHGNQWTSLHRTMDALFALGMAIDRVESLMPREMWSVLPGGMPYYVIR